MKYFIIDAIELLFYHITVEKVLFNDVFL